VSTRLDDIRVLTETIRRLDIELSVLRGRRNMLMFEEMKQAGTTERAMAEAANVSPAYAHRVKIGKGSPLSGPALGKTRLTPALEETDQ
jgi:hypothetical protein